MNTTLLIIMIILVFMSAFFSSAETAFSSLNKVRLKAMENEKNTKKIQRTLKLSDNYDMVLSTILIGNNVVNIASTSIATLFFTGILGDNTDLGATVSTVVMTIVVLIFGEITPKTVAKEIAESYALLISPILMIFIIIFYPLNIVFRGWKLLLNKVFGLGKPDTITEEELKTYVDEAHTGGEIDENESNLIRSSIEFNDLYASDILTPRIDVEAVDKYEKLSEIEKIFKQSGYSRLPVYIGDIDNIVGIIHHRDFEDIRSRGLKSLRTIIKPVPTVSPDTKISKLLGVFQKNKTHLAVVIDEFGGTEGIVTLEDIIEELVGEIWDEHDEVEIDIQKIDDKTYIVDAMAGLDDVFKFFNITDNDTDVSTVNGWIMENTDKIPELGDAFDYANLHIEVIETDGRRASNVKITIKDSTKNESE
ncbi:MAG TPA: HlyC/CorC family transporter [Ruminococcaceae bacterium]|nr:HlyC/CorC family transporter [Oscillospiraceae bacterium]